MLLIKIYNICITSIKQDWRAIKHIPKFSSLIYKSINLTDNRELALIAVKKRGLAFEYISPILQTDEEIITISLNNDPEIFHTDYFRKNCSAVYKDPKYISIINMKAEIERHENEEKERLEKIHNEAVRQAQEKHQREYDEMVKQVEEKIKIDEEIKSKTLFEKLEKFKKLTSFQIDYKRLKTDTEYRTAFEKGLDSILSMEIIKTILNEMPE